MSFRDFAKAFEMAAGTTSAALGHSNAWERSIRRFEAQDTVSPPAAAGVVFIGGSTFTFWSTLEHDMAPLPVINRGFGGATMDDLVRYVDRIVIPYQPRGVVVFAGANDVVARRPDVAQRVAKGFRAFTAHVTETLPDVLVFYVAITPTPSGMKWWSLASEANHLIHDDVRADPHLRFIDLSDLLQHADGTPDDSLYGRGGHPNARGYALWASRIKPALEAEFGRATRASG